MNKTELKRVQKYIHSIEIKKDDLDDLRIATNIQEVKVMISSYDQNTSFRIQKCLRKLIRNNKNIKSLVIDTKIDLALEVVFHAQLLKNLQSIIIM